MSGTTVSLDGSASSDDGPWGTNITYAWAVADGRGNPVTDLTVTGGDTATPSFVIPETVPDGGFVFTLSVQGKGHCGEGFYKSTDSVGVALVEFGVASVARPPTSGSRSRWTATVRAFATDAPLGLAPCRFRRQGRSLGAPVVYYCPVLLLLSSVARRGGLPRAVCGRQGGIHLTITRAA